MGLMPARIPFSLVFNTLQTSKWRHAYESSLQ